MLNTRRRLFSSSLSPTPTPLPPLPLLGSLQKNIDTLPLHNFSPGPTSLPKPVMKRIADELQSSVAAGNVSPMELSHRSPEFIQIKDNAEASLRRLFDLNHDDFEILFMHGGGHGQFAAVPLNLSIDENSTAHYFVTGTWSHRASSEGSKYCQITTKGRAEGWWEPTFLLPEDVPTPETTGLGATKRPSYAYLCSNETVNGIEYFDLPDLSHLQVPLVVDMSSDMGTKVIDFNKVDVAFACAPKNLGIPGLTIVIAHKELLRKRQARSITPGVLDWNLNAKNDCLWNTPATFNIYVTGLVAEWMEREGGIHEMEQRNIAKATLFYDTLDTSNEFWITPWKEIDDEYVTGSYVGTRRSRMNIPFKIAMDESGELTNKFIEGAFERNIVGLRTMTPFGWGEYLRASLYNSVTLHDVEVLVAWMKEFQGRYT